MSRLSVHLKKQNDIAKVRSQIEAVAAELQDVTEAKDSARQAVKQLVEQKSRLTKEITALENRIEDRKETIEALVERKKAVYESAKQQTREEKERLKEKQKALKQTVAEIDNVQTVAHDLQKSLNLLEAQRKEFQTLHAEAEKARKEYHTVSPKIQKEKAEMAAAEESLASMNKTVTDLYGKLASYVQVAKKTLTHINEQLEEKDIPLVFKVPEGEVIEIDIDNFDHA